MIEINSPFDLLIMSFGVYCILFRFKNPKPVRGVEYDNTKWFIVETGSLYGYISIGLEIARWFQ